MIGLFFSLLTIDYKQRCHKRNHCSTSHSVSLIFTWSYCSTLLITTPTPSLVKPSLQYFPTNSVAVAMIMKAKNISVLKCKQGITGFAFASKGRILCHSSILHHQLIYNFSLILPTVDIKVKLLLFSSKMYKTANEICRSYISMCPSGN